MMAWKYRLGQKVEVDVYGVEPWSPGMIISRSSIIKDTPYVVRLDLGDGKGHDRYFAARNIREPQERKA